MPFRREVTRVHMRATPRHRPETDSSLDEGIFLFRSVVLRPALKMIGPVRPSVKTRWSVEYRPYVAGQRPGCGTFGLFFTPCAGTLHVEGPKIRPFVCVSWGYFTSPYPGGRFCARYCWKRSDVIAGVCIASRLDGSCLFSSGSSHGCRLEAISTRRGGRGSEGQVHRGSRNLRRGWPGAGAPGAYGPGGNLPHRRPD